MRTVAGRLGHSGGGTTTLRAYAAWVSEADQRAAGGIATRMPSRPAPLEAGEWAHRDPQSPYEKIAAKLRDGILSGHLVEGDFAPTEKQLADENQVSIGTAHRAMELLKTWGFIRSSRGRRAIIVCPPELLNSVIDQLPSKHSALDAGTLTDTRLLDERNELPATAARLWAVTVRGPGGRRYPARHVCEDINRPDLFRAHLLAIARIEGLGETNGSDDWIGNYELEIREFGKEDREPILTLRWQH